MKTLIGIIASVVIVIGGLLYWLRDDPGSAPAISMSQVLASDTTGYDRALGPRPFSFPEDHGPHPTFKLEWWYFTGHLETEVGRPFGYQFTIFRNALAPPNASDGRTSSWATNQLYLAHFALSDIESDVFYAFERFSRGAAGLAGAQPIPFRVWLEDWEVAEGEEGMPSMKLSAEQDGVSLDLSLSAEKPMVLQGDQGYSVKGPGEGNASYYYSYTRLLSEGTVRVGGEHLEVTGLSWMDREWSTSMLSEGQVGWDWFSIQLSDGVEIMYFEVREEDATRVPQRHAALVHPDGQAREVDPNDVEVEVLDTWTNATGDRYPAGWQITFAGEDIDLIIYPKMADQELNVSIRYWEGAVSVEGRRQGRPVSGNGYVELTGYASGLSGFTDIN